MILSETQERVPITSVHPHPDNVRQGDIGAISVSLEAHGQYRPIVVQTSTNYILAGNHTWKAASALGWDQISATFVDVTDDQARRILLVDNRTNDLASYNDQGLADFLTELIESDLGLTGTGYEPDDLDDLIAALGPSDGDERYTPEWLFQAMNTEFDVDLAAPPGGIPYIPAKQYFTKDDNALEQDWTGLFAWCNPPYSVGALFGKKWNTETTEGVWLGPQTRGSPYRLELMKKAKALWLPIDLPFHKGSLEDEAEGIRYPTFLAGFGTKGQQALTNLGKAEPDRGVLLKTVK